MQPPAARQPALRVKQYTAQARSSQPGLLMGATARRPAPGRTCVQRALADGGLVGGQHQGRLAGVNGDGQRLLQLAVHHLARTRGFTLKPTSLCSPGLIWQRVRCGAAGAADARRARPGAARSAGHGTRARRRAWAAGQGYGASFATRLLRQFC